MIMFYLLNQVMGICYMNLFTFYTNISPKKEKKNTGFGMRQNWTAISASELINCVSSGESQSLTLFIYKKRILNSFTEVVKGLIKMTDA